jgi:hypothetical protein
LKNLNHPPYNFGARSFFIFHKEARIVTRKKSKRKYPAEKGDQVMWGEITADHKGRPKLKSLAELLGRRVVGGGGGGGCWGGGGCVMDDCKS